MIWSQIVPLQSGSSYFSNLKRTHDWRETTSEPYGRRDFAKTSPKMWDMMFLRLWPDSKRIPIWCNNCKKENPCGEVAPFKKASCIYFFFCHLPPSGLKSFGNFTAVVLRSPPPTEESTDARPRRQECAPAHAKTRNRARYFAKFSRKHYIGGAWTKNNSQRTSHAQKGGVAMCEIARGGI